MFARQTQLDFSPCLESEKFSDLKILFPEPQKGQPKSISVHKIVLAVGSKYFGRLLEEEEKAAISVPFSYKSFKPCLEFLYKGEVQIENDELEQFLATAATLGLEGFEPDAKPRIKRERTTEEDEDSDESPGPSKRIKSEASTSETKVKTVVEIPKFATQEDGRIRCLRCEKSFSALANAKRHYQDLHMEKNEVFQCQSCQSTFKTRNYLNVHLFKRHKITQKMVKSGIL